MKQISLFNIPKFQEYGNLTYNIGWVQIPRQIKYWLEHLGLILNYDDLHNHTWSEARSSAYIEYCIKNGKLGRNIMFNDPRQNFRLTDGYNPYLLVDGLQRLTAVMGFMENSIPVFGGHFLSDFKQSKEDVLASQYLNFHVNNLATHKDVLKWYVELNTDSCVNTRQEILELKKSLLNETN